MKRKVLSFCGALYFVAMIFGVVDSNVFAAPQRDELDVVYINGVRYNIYLVKKGDTLYSLAKNNDMILSDLIKLNPMLNDGLKIGQYIKLPFKVQPEPAKVVITERKIFDTHEVKRKETLYSISKDYDVSVATILADNAEVDPDHVSVGTILNIRIADQEESEESDVKSDLVDYHNHLKSVAPEGLKFYVVNEGDTYTSIGQRFKMNAKETARINDMRELMAKSIIMVRDLEYSPVNWGYRLDTDKERQRWSIFVNEGKVEQDEEIADEISEEVESVDSVEFTALGELDTLRVALLLPLSAGDRVMRPFAEFYSGFLLGVEELKMSGHMVDIALFNTERSADRVADIVYDDSLYRSCNLIVGPVYENLLSLVVQDAEQRGVPVVSPLATIKSIDSPVLFQMAPDEEHRYDKLEELLPIKSLEEREQEALAAEARAEIEARAEQLAMKLESIANDEAMESSDGDGVMLERPLYDTLVDGSLVVRIDSLPAVEPIRQVTLIYGENIDKKYASKLRADLSFKGVDFEMREYNYLHPTIINERRKAIEVEIEEMREESEFIGDTLDSVYLVRYRDSLWVEFEKSDLSTLVANGAKDNLFYIVADNEVAVDRTLSALASAYTAQMERSRGENGERIKEHVPSPYMVIANPDWSRYKNIDKSVYFRNNVMDFPTYVAGRDRLQVREFDGRYSAEFDAMPSLYSYRGYDVALIFGYGMYGDIEYGMANKVYIPLQNGYRFERGEQKKLRRNVNWMRVEYEHNFTLTID